MVIPKVFRSVVQVLSTLDAVPEEIKIGSLFFRDGKICTVSLDRGIRAISVVSGTEVKRKILGISDEAETRCDGILYWEPWGAYEMEMEAHETDDGTDQGD